MRQNKGSERYQRKGSEYRWLVRIDELLRRLLQPPTSYSGSLGARFGEERRGKWRGEGGLYIDTGWGRNGRAVKGIDEGE
jgi:hypothetical protein